MKGYSTSSADQRAFIHRAPRPVRKGTMRYSDGVQHPVEIHKIEPVIPTTRSMSAVRAEITDRLGRVPRIKTMAECGRTSSCLEPVGHKGNCN